MRNLIATVLGLVLGSPVMGQAGTIACWGANWDGQCDAPDGVFTQVAGGGYHSIGLREDGTIACWGNNFSGQCDAPDGVFTQVAGGRYHSIGLREDGTIACWA